MAAIHSEIKQLWSEVSGEVDLEIGFDVLPSDLLAEADAEASAAGLQHFQPWLAILEQCIQWLAGLHASMAEALSNGAVDREDRAPQAVIGAAAAYATAVRRLVLSGLDSPARAVLRSLAESLNLATALLSDADFRRAFGSREASENPNEFWYQNLRDRELQKRLAKAEALLAIPADLRAEIQAERKRVSRWLSLFVHPSYLMAQLTALPRSVTEPEMHRVGTVGLASRSSIHTLDLANRLIWEFARIGFPLIAKDFGGKSFHVFDPENELDQIAVIGHAVLVELVDRHISAVDPFLEEDERAILESES